MFHNYSEQKHYVKTHSNQLMSEAAQARKTQESETQSTRNTKKRGLSALWSGRASNITPTVYLSVRY